MTYVSYGSVRADAAFLKSSELHITRFAYIIFLCTYMYVLDHVYANMFICSFDPLRSADSGCVAARQRHSPVPRPPPNRTHFPSSVRICVCHVIVYIVLYYTPYERSFLLLRRVRACGMRWRWKIPVSFLRVGRQRWQQERRREQRRRRRCHHEIRLLVFAVEATLTFCSWSRPIGKNKNIRMNIEIFVNLYFQSVVMNKIYINLWSTMIICFHLIWIWWIF